MWLYVFYSQCELKNTHTHHFQCIFFSFYLIWFRSQFHTISYPLNVHSFIHKKKLCVFLYAFLFRHSQLLSEVSISVECYLGEVFFCCSKDYFVAQANSANNKPFLIQFYFKYTIYYLNFLVVFWLLLQYEYCR